MTVLGNEGMLFFVSYMNRGFDIVLRRYYELAIKCYANFESEVYGHFPSWNTSETIETEL